MSEWYGNFFTLTLPTHMSATRMPECLRRTEGISQTMFKQQATYLSIEIWRRWCVCTCACASMLIKHYVHEQQTHIFKQVHKQRKPHFLIYVQSHTCVNTHTLSLTRIPLQFSPCKFANIWSFKCSTMCCYLATYSHYVKKMTLDPLSPTVWLVEAELQRAA